MKDRSFLPHNPNARLEQASAPDRTAPSSAAKPAATRPLAAHSRATRSPLPRRGAPLHVTNRLHHVCDDISKRCPELAHVDMTRILVSFTTARNRSAFGLQARISPMRFQNGAEYTTIRGRLYQVQKCFADDREMLYIVTFCLPRFLDLSLQEKFITIFHELYHINPHFNGDIRRHQGRCAIHTSSKKAYDDYMATLVVKYLQNHPNPELFDFLHGTTEEITARYGGIIGTKVPRPRMIPVKNRPKGPS